MTIGFLPAERSNVLRGLRRAWHRTVVALVVAGTLNASTAKPASDFGREIPALFEKHCLKCHGPEKQKGGLRFDRKEGALKSGDSGEMAIVPGKATESRLIKLVSSTDEDERMPPKDGPLSAAEIALLRKWIDAGAAWPGQGASTNTVARSEMIVTDEDRRHWSFLPLRRPPVPTLQDKTGVGSPVDQFILARLKKAGIGLSPQANAQKLVRRIYFDLVGLPPTPEQVDCFAKGFAANSRAAVEALLDELLASPHYGERWGRHWLDVVRYADSDGQESDRDRPTAHHYRDFVIRSLNEDRPFNTFLQWQLAGDELEPDNSEAIVATGFIVAGPHAALTANLMQEERDRNRFNELDDMIATTGSAMLGLTLACARCHDHKYDPLPTRDYYRLQSAFNGGDRAEVPLASLEAVRHYREAHGKWKKEFDSVKKRFDECVAKARKSHEKTARDTKIDALKINDEEKTLLKEKADSKEAKALSKKFSKELEVKDKDCRKLLSEEEREEWDAREKAFKEAQAREPAALPTAYAFADFSAKPRETFLLARGDFRVKSEPVELGFLTALTRGHTDYWATARAQSRRNDSTQQRRALAAWMTDLEGGAGALAARVMVNRLWQHHFGEGLVRTVNDFGSRCDPPTHPELLEWLASEFVENGWKLKPLHRMVMTSSVYLQDTKFDAAKAKVDPENRLLWRRRPHRLEAEILRDSMLAVSGKLNTNMHGPAVRGPIAAEAIQARNVQDPYPSDIKDSSSTRRRSVYMFHKRVVPSPLLQAFDGPDAQASCGRRENTTVAPQALALLNDRFVRARAVNFAERIVKEAAADLSAQVRLAWRLALGREPSTNELESGIAFVNAQREQRATRTAEEKAVQKLALADFCQAIFAFNEFIYVD